MVRDITWKAACDNCFCAMGSIRCVPLACAPPLQGCKPIVREGQCCPSTYNCSGTIQVKADQNYASYAFISKDYAKFRKETNFYPAIHDTRLSSVEGRGHRIVEETFELGSINPEIITESLSDVTDPGFIGLETETMNNEILRETTDYVKRTTLDQEHLTSTATELPIGTESGEDESATSTLDLIMTGMASFAAHLQDDTIASIEETSTDAPLMTDNIAGNISAGNEKEPDPVTANATATATVVNTETKISHSRITSISLSLANLNTTVSGGAQEHDVFIKCYLIDIFISQAYLSIRYFGEGSRKYGNVELDIDSKVDSAVAANNNGYVSDDAHEGTGY
ncbi:hypothetical protein QAD02_017174 [Eretmocerus hayati]|uniref:Uncharacterized protein n=1 Tax=Eretmocerus hayati TaxID=131215 RepID=A0ACC2PG13_9HYME|nr:hypothetical protein QAD02_017174 [Eretmocerus hayati]